MFAIFLFLQCMTGLLFPMGMKCLMHQLEDIVKDWYQLGRELGLPTSKLQEIESNNHGNIRHCKALMLEEWERRPALKPSWSSLVDALHKMNENTIADRISQQFSELFTLKLLRLRTLPSQDETSPLFILPLSRSPISSPPHPFP